MVANENNYNINGTTSDSSPSPTNSQAITDLQNLQNYINTNESIIKRLNERINRLEQENRALKSSGLKTLLQKYPDLKKEIAKAVEGAVESVLSVYVDAGMQSPSRAFYQASSPHLTQLSTPDRSIDENTNSVTSNSNNFPCEINSPEMGGSLTLQKPHETRKPENSDLNQEATEEPLRDLQQYGKHNEDEGTPSDLTLMTNGSTRINNNNNNYNNNYYNNNNNGRRYNNNYSNSNNNMAKRKAHTAFVSWTGQMAPETVRNLFPPKDVRDVRQSQNKSFAHIDFVDPNALERALEKNGMDLSQYGVPGSLRVEKGKPRDNNNNNNNNNNNYNNNQRPQPQQQYQNPNQQNKNRNGFTNFSSINSIVNWNNPSSLQGAESSSVITNQQEHQKQEENM